MFLNEDRKRYYGLRIGDIVSHKYYKPDRTGVINAFGIIDNNCVYVCWNNSDPVPVSADQLIIIKKVDQK